MTVFRNNNFLVVQIYINPPVTVCWHTAVMLLERCCPKLLRQLHSEAAVLVDTALEADVAASAAETADSLLLSKYI